MFVRIGQQQWKAEREKAIDESKTNSLTILGGDARCECMDFGDQFGTYSLMDLTINKLLDIQPILLSDCQGSLYAIV